MIAVIRIKGQINLSGEIKETFERLKLRRKYVCVILREKPEILGMVKKLENFVAYGKIDTETFIELIKKRGKAVKKDKKIDAEKITKEFTGGKTEKKLEELGIKGFFRLHPPRGGIKTKEHFPKGVLGNHGEKINLLIRRML